MKQDDLQGFEILSQAPTRISFAGGGTDVSPYPETYGGTVINATISIYMLARLRLRNDTKVVIEVNTRPQKIIYPDVTQLEYDGRLDFVKAIVKKIYTRSEGFELYFHSSLPLRSGLGGSGAMCVAILGAFNQLLEHKRLNNYQLAELAFRIETDELGNASGRQDQYAAAFGGLNQFEFIGGDHVRVNPVNVPLAGCRTLNHALMLLWLGERNPSGRIIEDQVEGINKGGDQLEAMHATKRCIPEMLEALHTVDIRRIGELLDGLWQQKKRFSKFISNPEIDDIYARLQEAGMIGGKVTGAGGGGHMLACCEIDRRDEVLAVAERLGVRPVPFAFVHEGILSWTSPIRTILNGAQSDVATYLPARGERTDVPVNRSVKSVEQ